MPKNVDHPDIVVIGASAGGVAALRTVLGGLPQGFPATVFVVMHVAPESPDVLSHLLDAVTALPVMTAADGNTFRPGEVWIAAVDRHLAVERDHMTVVRGPRENRHRPSVDVLFRSAALSFGPRVVGVVLTGMLDDGAAGVWAIKRRGGLAIVQDPADAEFPSMPQSALETVEVDHCVPLRDIARTLVAAVAGPVADDPGPAPIRMEQELAMTTQGSSTMEQLDALGTRSSFTCPECGGALWEMNEPPPRYRCHVGHAYGLHTLEVAQAERIEAALWASIRSLEEGQKVSERLARHARGRGHHRSVQQYEERAREDGAHADTLRRMLHTLPARAGQAGNDADAGPTRDPSVTSGETAPPGD
jgi:two-component system chemotaxis response regulator CheB